MPKMQPLSGNQRPDFLTALMNMSLVLHLPRKMHLCRSSSNAPRLPSSFEMPQNPHVCLLFDKIHNPLRLPRETTSERPKLVRACGAFHILTLKCASLWTSTKTWRAHRHAIDVVFTNRFEWRPGRSYQLPLHYGISGGVDEQDDIKEVWSLWRQVVTMIFVMMIAT